MNDHEATLVRAGGRPILRFERHLHQPVEAVWHAVTDPTEMRSWFPTRIEIDEWKVGATLTHHFDGQGIDPLPGVVVEWDPPHRVRFTWGEDTIAFGLTPSPGGGTIFVLTEELGAHHAARNAAGWESCLDHLEHRPEGPGWQQRFGHYVAVFEPILGHQEGPPTGHGTMADVTFSSVAPVIRVQDLDRALRRYRKLGFSARAYEGPDRYGFAQRGGVELHLSESLEHDRTRDGAEIYLYVSDADALYSAWSSSGVKGRFIPPHDTPYGLREFAFVDRDGTAHRIGSPLRQN